MPAGNDAFFIGLISGTSRDGVDAALVDIADDRIDLLHAFCNPYPPAIRHDLDRLLSTGQPPAPGIAAALDEQLGRFFARTANELIGQAGVEKRDIRAVGSHGQTVWHKPEGDRPVSIQLGNGPIITRSTGIVTVGDFRRADLVAGGQGAPLAPLLHRRLFHSPDEDRAVLNIGGITNLTLLRHDGGLTGFDCGPGNCLMDAWIGKVQEKPFDEDGEWAAAGSVDEELLGRLLDDPWFALAPPKSTGLEYFNLAWLESKTAGYLIGEQDLQCTLAELTASSVARCIPAEVSLARLLVCGGGIHNRYLMSRLRKNLPGLTVDSTRGYGVDPDWVEAILFAWLARERLAERMQDTSPVTGASRPVLLGKVFGKERKQVNGER